MFTFDQQDVRLEVDRMGSVVVLTVLDYKHGTFMRVQVTAADGQLIARRLMTESLQAGEQS